MKRSRAEPSRAENPSARAMARASSARAHHYYLGIVITLMAIQISEYLDYIQFWP